MTQTSTHQLPEQATTELPAGITLDPVEFVPFSAFNSQEVVVRSDGRNIGTVIRHEFNAGVAWEVLAGYRSTDATTLADAVAVAIEMRDRWDGVRI